MESKNNTMEKKNKKSLTHFGKKPYGKQFLVTKKDYDIQFLQSHYDTTVVFHERYDVLGYPDHLIVFGMAKKH